MMNEWVNSLYQSRRFRYQSRAEAVRRCIDTYLAQYDALNKSIVEERSGLLACYDSIEQAFIDQARENREFFIFHIEFYKLALAYFQGQISKAFHLLHDLMRQYQRFCGGIRRHGLRKVEMADTVLKTELAQSCKGLITGETD